MKRKLTYLILASLVALKSFAGSGNRGFIDPIILAGCTNPAVVYPFQKVGSHCQYVSSNEDQLAKSYTLDTIFFNLTGRHILHSAPGCSNPPVQYPCKGGISDISNYEQYVQWVELDSISAAINRLVISGAGWKLTGNSGTNYLTNFIGTTDSSSFMIKVNNQMAGLLLNNKHTTNQNHTFYGIGAGNINDQSQYTTAIGYNCAHALDTVNDGGTFCGFETYTTQKSGYDNTAFGALIMQNSTGCGDNTCMGFAALQMATDASNCTVMGDGALQNGTTCQDMVCIGVNAGQHANTALGCTYVGNNAGNNEVGSHNTAIGDISMFTNGGGHGNTMVGFESGLNGVSSNNNCGVGIQAFYNLTGGGGENCGIGDNVGGNATALTNCSFLGTAPTVSNNLTNGTAIGSFVTLKYSNTMILGDTINGVRIGAGTSAPDNSAKLDLESTSMGFLKPQMTTTQQNAISSPKTGLQIFNTTQNTPAYYNGTWFQQSSAIFTNNSRAIDSNSSAEVSILPAGIGTKTFPANFFVPGKTVEIIMYGIHSALANPNITIKVKFGSTVLCTTGTVASGNSTNALSEIRVMITCYSSGSGGEFYIQGKYQEDGGGINTFPMTSTTATIINTTTTQTLDVTQQWGTASGNDYSAWTNASVKIQN